MLGHFQILNTQKCNDLCEWYGRAYNAHCVQKNIQNEKKSLILVQKIFLHVLVKINFVVLCHTK